MVALLQFFGIAIILLGLIALFVSGLNGVIIMSIGLILVGLSEILSTLRNLEKNLIRHFSPKEIKQMMNLSRRYTFSSDKIALYVVDRDQFPVIDIGDEQYLPLELLTYHYEPTADGKFIFKLPDREEIHLKLDQKVERENEDSPSNLIEVNGELFVRVKALGLDLVIDGNKAWLN